MVIKQDHIFTPVRKNRPLHIYLPDGYAESQERYPVMYFFDGHNLFLDEDATFGKSWGLKEFLDQWEKPMIVVGIECGYEGDERLIEYLPYPGDRGEWKERKGIGDQTLAWMVEELKPYIDQTYRTQPLRECTGIAGSSMGGLMALYGAVHYNRWFSKAACISSAIGFCMKPLMRDMEEQKMDPDTKIYLSWGTREAYRVKHVNQEDRSSYTYQRNAAVAKKAEQKGAQAMLRCQIGGRHCEADWEKLVPEFMEFLWD